MPLVEFAEGSTDSRLFSRTPKDCDIPVVRDTGVPDRRLEHALAPLKAHIDIHGVGRPAVEKRQKATEALARHIAKLNPLGGESLFHLAN